MKIFITIIAQLLYICSSYAQPNILDQSFDPGIGSNGLIRKTIVQPDGKIIVAGSFTEWDGHLRTNIARLNSDGSLDQSFNTSEGPNNTVWAVCLQPDGKIIIGGDFNKIQTTSRNRIARLNIDGSLDETFDPKVGPNDEVRCVVVENDGNILIGGWFTKYNDTPQSRLARLKSNGNLDQEFQSGQGANNSVEVIKIDQDGYIYLGGEFKRYDGLLRDGIAKINSDGTINEDFTPEMTGSVYTIEIQKNKKILVGGRIFYPKSGSGCHITRLNIDGSRDPFFSRNLGENDNSAIYAIAIQVDEKIMIGGEFDNSSGTYIPNIARLDTFGFIDNTFAIFYPIHGQLGNIHILPNDRYLISGFFKSFDGIARNGIARIGLESSLPVKIINFKLKNKNCLQELTWETGVEENLYCFEIERSTDGLFYSKIFQLLGKGNSSKYIFKDLNSEKENYFYRLKLKYNNGELTYSNSIYAENNCLPKYIKVYPNPTKNKVTIQGIQKPMRLQITDLSGMLLKIAIIDKELFHLFLTGFAEGIYNLNLVEIKSGKTIYTKKIIKL